MSTVSLSCLKSQYLSLSPNINGWNFPRYLIMSLCGQSGFCALNPKFSLVWWSSLFICRFPVVYFLQIPGSLPLVFHIFCRYLATTPSCHLPCSFFSSISYKLRFWCRGLVRFMFDFFLSFCKTSAWVASTLPLALPQGTFGVWLSLCDVKDGTVCHHVVSFFQG